VRSLSGRYSCARSVMVHWQSINHTRCRPQENPANRFIHEGAGDAGAILLGLVIVVNVRLALGILTQRPQLLKASLNIFVAVRRALDNLGTNASDNCSNRFLHPPAISITTRLQEKPTGELCLGKISVDRYI
jgi:hypothetical protein